MSDCGGNCSAAVWIYANKIFNPRGGWACGITGSRCEVTDYCADLEEIYEEMIEHDEWEWTE